jgi:hypothetical protein
MLAVMALRQKVSRITTAGNGLGVGDWLDRESDEDEAANGSIEDEDDDNGSVEEEVADTNSEAGITELIATLVEMLGMGDNIDVQEAKSEEIEEE